MRVMVIVKATEDSENGILPTTEAMEAMGRFNQDLVKPGILRTADGLKPSAQGKRIAFNGPSRTVIDGRFTETKELVAGFWFWDVKDINRVGRGHRDARVVALELLVPPQITPPPDR